MAKKDNKAKRGLTREQLFKIWQVLGPAQWLEIAKAYRPTHKFAYVNSTTLKGQCLNPQHTDSTPSFHILPERGFAHCMGCSYHTNNPIALVALMMESTDAEALQYLQEQHKMAFLGKKMAAELETQRVNQLTKQAIYNVSHDLLCEAIGTPGKYPYANNAIDWLVNQRMVRQDILHALPVGIMPPLAEITQRLVEQYKKEVEYCDRNSDVPTPISLAERAVSYLEAVFKDSTFCGSIVWPLHASPTEIARLKLRLPHNRKPKDIVIIEDEFEDLLGLYGLGWELYRTFVDPKTPIESAYLTEGEMDVMSLMARWAVKGIAPFPIFSVGGKGGSAHIEPILKSCGISRAYIIGDSPQSKGDNIAQQWLGKTKAINCSIFTHDGWDQLNPAMDLDEAVVKLGEDKVEEVVWKTTDNFVPAWRWAISRATEDIDAIPEDDLRVRLEKAAEHGRYLRNNLDCSFYTEEMGRIYPKISPSLLKQEIIKREDTELGFIANCTDVLRDMLIVIAHKSSASGNQLVLYDKKYQQLRHIRIDSDQSLIQELAPMIGMPYQFLKENVGFPSCVETPDNTEGLVLQRLDKFIRSSFKNVLSSMALGSEDYDKIPRYRQGYHYLTNVYERPLEYIVCGSDIFAIERTESDCSYRKLDGPTDNGILFDIPADMRAPWYPGGLSTQILEEGKKVDLLGIFKDLEKYFNVGFKFKNHESTSTLLAGVMMSTIFMNAMPRQLLLFVTGESGSGKSSLIAAFSGINYPPLKLLYCSQGFDNYSAVGVFRNAEADSRLMVLDEFEYTNSEKADHVRKILELVRGLATNDAHRTIAKQGGGTETTHYKLPMMFAAISGAEKPQDLNRMLIIETQKVDGRDKTENVLKNTFGASGIRDLAKRLAVGVYPHIPAIMQHYKEVDESFARLQLKATAGIEQRYASSLFGPLAIMKYLGLDWESFFLKFVDQNSASIQRATNISESESYLKAMLFNSVIYRDETKTQVSIAHLLANPERREDINSSGCGVYYDKSTRNIMLVIEQVMSKILPSHYRFRGAMTSTRLREVLSRHKLALPLAEVVRSNIIARATPYIGAGVTPEDIVVFHADPWLVEGNVIANEATAPTEKPNGKTENAEGAEDTPKPLDNSFV